jgi:hypothetical protein
MSAELFKELVQEVKGELGNRVTEAKSFFRDVLADVGAEVGRLYTQGRAEIAQSLFSESNAYVPYGDGQRSEEPGQSKQVENEGREM